MVAPDTAGVKIAVPIDIPFQELDRIVESQFVGKTFPEGGGGSAAITVKRASVAASGDRLLISLLVDASEQKSFFGFGTEATLHIWGKPVLDQEDQTLRLADMRTRGRIRSRVRPARRRRARRRAVSGKGNRRQGGGRSQAGSDQCPSAGSGR